MTWLTPTEFDNLQVSKGPLGAESESEGTEECMAKRQAVVTVNTCRHLRQLHY